MDLPKRKPNRLKEYDYSGSGAYFVTICTHNRKRLFSEIAGAAYESPVLNLTSYGKIVDHYINQLPGRFGIRLDHYVIMPNHVHLLVSIENTDGPRVICGSPLQERSTLSKIVGFLKMNVSKEIHKSNPSAAVWQRSFYDHVIRSEADYREIWEYIERNPAKWREDCFYQG